MLLSPIHCCDVTKPPFLLSGELCTSPLHSNRLYVYTVCCRRRSQCFSVLRTCHTDEVGDSSGRSYVTKQGHNVPLLRTHGLVSLPVQHGNLLKKFRQDRSVKTLESILTKRKIIRDWQKTIETTLFKTLTVKVNNNIIR